MARLDHETLREIEEDDGDEADARDYDDLEKVKQQIGSVLHRRKQEAEMQREQKEYERDHDIRTKTAELKRLQQRLKLKYGVPDSRQNRDLGGPQNLSDLAESHE